MQSLSGKLASLNRFLAKSAERALPFFNTLKKYNPSENKARYAMDPRGGGRFSTIKGTESCTTPSLTHTFPEETLYAYLAAKEIILKLIRGVRSFTDCQSKTYSVGQKTSGKLAKYAVEIGTYKISFIPRNAVKGQVLADFLFDAPDGEREDEYFWRTEVSPGIDDTEAWTLHTDGAASSKGLGAGLILTGPSRVEYAYALG
ncbi:hypothetical protein Tco_0077517 [Tanacetum coccineum]